MHKNTRLLPYMRRAMYNAWLKGQTVVQLSKEYKVTRKIVYQVLERAKLRDFNNHLSINHRFKTITYGLRKLNLVEKRLEKKVARSWIKRYEKDSPGEMVHFDTKRLPLLRGEAKLDRREHLHVAIDDFSRYLIADIFPDKGQYSSSMHLQEVLSVGPFTVEIVYSDNGSAYRGRKDHAFVEKCLKNGLVQKFTKTRHPQTNGKAERVIRTLMEEWHRMGTFRTRAERRQSLQDYVNYYNFQRSHSALNGLAPIQRIANYFAADFVYNA